LIVPNSNDTKCKDNEIQPCFGKFKVIYKEKGVIKSAIDGEEYTSAYLDYILMKN
jgi:hypothetical protein